MKKNSLGRLSKVLAQSIVCFGLFAVPAAASTATGCATVDQAAGALPAYERLSFTGFFDTANRLLSSFAPGMGFALSLMAAPSETADVPCKPAASVAVTASKVWQQTRRLLPAVDTDIATASIGQGRKAPAADGPFGSVALPFGRLPALTRMEPIYQAIRDGDFLSCATGCSDASASLEMVVHSVADAGFVEKLKTINTAVNHILAYRRDIDGYGSNDYWATPQEALDRRSGDCEDFAIVKMAALERLGVPMASMSLIVLRDQERNLFHAVLAVNTSRGYFILDNLRADVASDSAYPHYLALYSISAGRGFIYGRPVTDRPAMASAAHLASVAPGEGPDDGGREATDTSLFLAAALSADAIPID